MAATVSLDDILDAQRIIEGKVHRTPVTGSSQLSRRHGMHLFFKHEELQKTGAFKIRGVLNHLYHLPDEEKQKGVVTISAGNHAQALACGAAQYGISSTIVMPASAVKTKVLATQAYGGEVILTENDLMDTCLAIQKERDLTLVHPFDDPRIIAGQGTVGLEMLEDVPDVDIILTGIGGGGLISGVAAAVKARKPAVRIIGVEPVHSCAMKQSLEQGVPVRLTENKTVADGLAAPFAGKHTLAHVQEFVDEVLLVDDDAIVEAMIALFEWCKIVAEPAAAAGLAALMQHQLDIKPDAKVVCIISGGNIDRIRLKELI